jgi:hypothetical protein
VNFGQQVLAVATYKGINKYEISYANLLNGGKYSCKAEKRKK